MILQGVILRNTLFYIDANSKKDLRRDGESAPRRDYS
jgi:hypothetical protein